MNEWVMIHHINSLCDNGEGLMIQAIAQQLNMIAQHGAKVPAPGRDGISPALKTRR